MAHMRHCAKGAAMTLIEEIEAAARRGPHPDSTTADPYPGEWYAIQLLKSPYWSRIVAALEAGQEMDELLKFSGTPTFPAQAKFRASMGR